MAIIDGKRVHIRPDPDRHAMTFSAADAQNPDAMAESRRRGAQAGLAKALAARHGRRSPVDPIVDLDAVEFVAWLTQKETARDPR